MKPFFSITMACCDVKQYIRESPTPMMKQSFVDRECLCGIAIGIGGTFDFIAGAVKRATNRMRRGGPERITGLSRRQKRQRRAFGMAHLVTDV